MSDEFKEEIMSTINLIILLNRFNVIDMWKISKNFNFADYYERVKK